MIKLITKTDIIKNVPVKYRKAYPTNYEFFDGTFSDDVYNQLINNMVSTEDEITKIIGNDSWTRNACDECNQDVFTAIQLGEETDWESNTFKICPDCLNKTKTLFDNNI
jgi:hypothetical protein